MAAILRIVTTATALVIVVVVEFVTPVTVTIGIGIGTTGMVTGMLELVAATGSGQLVRLISSRLGEAVRLAHFQWRVLLEDQRWLTARLVVLMVAGVDPVRLAVYLFSSPFCFLAALAGRAVLELYPESF
jgi:hypothetical protein